MNKVALGLLRFDISEAGEPAAMHRYCTQVVLPLLGAIADRTAWRVSIAADGASLEFLDENYPDAVALFRNLLRSGQAEMISSSYLNGRWSAFPARDFERLNNLNRAVLKRLQLPQGRCLYVPEGNFGSGLPRTDSQFDFFVVKDTDLRSPAPDAIERPLYRHGNVPILIAANHIIHEMARAAIRSAENGGHSRPGLFERNRIEEGVRLTIHSAAGIIDGSATNMRWHWYHAGGAHHFTSRASPFDWESFFLDSAWLRATFDRIESLGADGWRFTTLTEFAHELLCDPMIAAASLPMIPRASVGAAPDQWAAMRHPAAASALALTWRSRGSLRSIEETPAKRDELEELWKLQLMAQYARPQRGFGNAAALADTVIRRCHQLALPPTKANRANDIRENPCNTPWAEAELVGAYGEIEWTETAGGVQYCNVHLRSDASDYGIRFRRAPGVIAYCASGLEGVATEADPSVQGSGSMFLPLANGLIGLDQDLALIRINALCPLPAAVSDRNPWVLFAFEGAAEGRAHDWRFVIVRGPIGEAIKLANRLNMI